MSKPSRGRLTVAVSRAWLITDAATSRRGYWEIGAEILRRQQQEGWGAKVIDRLATDLRAEFPGVKGFSRTSLHYMRQFAAEWPDGPFVQGGLGQISWYHHVGHGLDALVAGVAATRRRNQIRTESGTAGKKAAATRHTNVAEDAAVQARRAAGGAIDSAVSAGKLAGEAVRHAGKAAAARAGVVGKTR